MKKIMSKINRSFLSRLATFALVITTVAANQRCWYIMYEDKLPANYKKLRKF